MTAQTILPANSATAATGYNVTNSLRFNESDDCLIKTFGSAGNRKLWTYSVWFKRGKLGGSYALFVSGASGGNDEGTIRIEADKIDWQNYDVGTSAADGQLLTNQLIRDPSAWYHLVCAYDSANSTAGNRMRMYLNGSEVTSFATDNNPSVNYDSATNNAVLHNIGRQSWNSSADFAGYMAEICFIDGAALGPTSFGEFDGDSPTIWKPLESVEDLTFGDNGFYLEFKQSGTGTDANGMGADTSGEDNHFAVNNLTAVDQSTDTCTNNFLTWNPLDDTDLGDLTFSEGNLKVVNATGVCRGTLAASSGKWYWEIKQITAVDASNPIQYGIADTEDSPPTHSSLNNALIAYSDNGDNKAIKKFAAGTGSTITNTMGSFNNIAQNDIIQFAFDADTAKLWVGRNGTYLNSGDPANGTGEVASTNAGNFFTPCLEHAGVTYTIESNFGSPPYAVSSGNTDGRVHGDFEYAPPSGFFAWNTKNLAEFG